MRTKPRQHGGGVAGAGSDIEHMVGMDDLRKLQQLGEWGRSGKEAVTAKRVHDIGIGQRLAIGRQEGLARHVAHGGQDAMVGHRAGAQLVVDHPEAGSCEVGHVGSLGWRRQAGA
jgi:hypothetical protein